MYPCTVCHDNRTFQNAEAAFQSAKCANEADKDRFVNLNGKDAKRLGRQIQMKPDWDITKLAAVKDILKDKFTRNPDLKQKLLQTGNIPIVEENTWNDRYWGVCNGQGSNHLGKLLMNVRAELQAEKIIQQTIAKAPTENASTKHNALPQR